MESVSCSNHEICSFLGVTPEKGTCQRHPNIVIYQPKNQQSSRNLTQASFNGANIAVTLCPICDSENKAGGRKQRKTFANLIEDIKGMHETTEWEEYKLMTWGAEEVQDGSRVQASEEGENFQQHDQNNSQEEISCGNRGDAAKEKPRLSNFHPESRFGAWNATNTTKGRETGGTATHLNSIVECSSIDEHYSTASSDDDMDEDNERIKMKGKKLPPTSTRSFVLQLQHEQRNLLKAEFKNHVEIRDRTKKFKTYKSCFIASDIIDFMVKSGYVSTRQEGVRLGRALQLKYKIFDHVTYKNEKRYFDDDYLFFRFFDDEDEVDGIDDDGDTDNGYYWKLFTDAELQDFAKKFQQYAELNATDRNYHMKTYSKCFVAKHAIDFMVKLDYAKTRNHAVKLGRALQSRLKLFEHVTKDHDFADDNLYFRLLDDEERQEALLKLPSRDDFQSLAFDNIIMEEGQLEELAKEFQMNVDIQDREVGDTVYPQCFIASEAIDFIVNSEYSTSRDEAVKLARALQNRFHLFEHVSEDYCFDDKKDWYFHYCDSPGAFAKAEAQKSGKGTSSSKLITNNTTSASSLLPDQQKPTKKKKKTVAKKAVKFVSKRVGLSSSSQQSSNQKIAADVAASLSHTAANKGNSDRSISNGNNTSDGVHNESQSSIHSARPMANGSTNAVGNSGLSLSSVDESLSGVDYATVNEDFMVSIAKRAAQVSAWNKKSLDRSLSSSSSLGGSHSSFANNEDFDKLKAELQDLKESSKVEIANLKIEINAKDSTIEEHQARIERLERQLIYELRLIAAEKRARAKQGNDIVQNQNDIATNQVDKAKFDLASAQEMASQKEATLKSAIRVQAEAFVELKAKYERQNEEIEELKKNNGKGGGDTMSSTYKSNANLVNQLEKLKRDFRATKEVHEKEKQELETAVEHQKKEKDIYKTKFEKMENQLSSHKKQIEKSIVQDLRILTKAKTKKLSQSPAP